MNKHIKLAIEKYADGSQTKLAALLGGKCRQGHVHQWLYDLKKPSPHYSKRIEQVTNREVQALVFHPDIFGPTEDAA